jgi:hypothetical protein
VRPDRTGVFGRRGVAAPDRTGFGDRFPLKKKLANTFFFGKGGRMGTEEGMGNIPASSVGSDDVLQVESKWPYLLRCEPSRTLVTRTPGHRSPGPWSQGIFLFYFYFFWSAFIFFKAWMIFFKAWTSAKEKTYK